MADDRRTALITGASAGIGLAIAEAMAAKGWRLALGARRAERLQEAADKVSAIGAEVCCVPLDIADADSIEGFFETTEKALGVADIVVNNAGWSRPSAFHEYKAEAMVAELTTNLVGPALFSRRALRSLLSAGKGGDVVFIGSDAALHPRPEQVLYGAAKAGLENLARGLARELEGSGIRVATIRVGPTVSEFGSEWDLSDFEERYRLWQRHGLRDARLLGALLPASAVANAVVETVTRPEGVWIDTIEIQPAAPRSEEERRG